MRHRLSHPSPIEPMPNPLVRAALALVLAQPLGAQAFGFYARGPYRPNVPRPEQITGYQAGEQHTMYAVMQRYLDTLLATAPDRVRAETWGQTVEHRPYRVLIISDPANIGRIEQIRSAIAELTDPRKTSPARANAIAAFERHYLQRLLQKTSGNISLAARLCGKERSRLARLLKKHGLDRLSFAART